MQKSFKEYKEYIKSINPQYDKESETIRLALVNIIDDWEEERGKYLRGE
jgi:hypothetical protein